MRRTLRCNCTRPEMNRVTLLAIHVGLTGSAERPDNCHAHRRRLIHILVQEIVASPTKRQATTRGCRRSADRDRQGRRYRGEFLLAPGDAAQARQPFAGSRTAGCRTTSTRSGARDAQTPRPARNRPIKPDGETISPMKTGERLGIRIGSATRAAAPKSAPGGRARRGWFGSKRSGVQAANIRVFQ
jgi:hypothetical protein